MQILARARALEAAGRDVVHMEVGEPDLAPPEGVAEAACRALTSGDSGYTPSTGLPALRRGIAEWYGRRHNLDLNPQRVLVTPGASGAFLVLYLVLLEAGEAVLLPDPGYPCQRHFVRLAGGEPVSVPVGPAGRYHLDSGHMKDHWGRNARAVVVTSPGNPTGTLIEPDVLEELLAACRSRGAALISDEIYHGLVYGRERVPSALELDDGAIVVNGFSKRWAMTGYRVGWMVVPERLIDPCQRVMQNVFIAAATASQHGALAALAPEMEGELAAMVPRYDARRKRLLEALPGLGFKVAVPPEGAFYVYADASALTDDGERFCAELLEETGVAITPGADFGDHRAGVHVRFSYATSLERIETGLERLRGYLAK